MMDVGQRPKVFKVDSLRLAAVRAKRSIRNYGLTAAFAAVAHRKH
jgi:hypothetical protein